MERRYGAKLKGAKNEPAFNIAPGGEILALPNTSRDEIIWMKWGIKPDWMKRKSTGLINVRFESVTDKPIFKKYLLDNRCLIPADGFYEWKTESGKKQPYFFKFEDDRVFSFAGIWEQSAEGISAAILTMPPNDLVGKIHNRMPCILDTENEDLWLNPADGFDLKRAFEPRKLNGLISYKVGLGVNYPGNKGAELIEKL